MRTKNKLVELVIVDDNKMILNGIISILNKDDNIAVKEVFYNAQDLLDYLNNNTIDLIILDVNLPDINGLELCKIIGRLYSEINLMLLTNYDELNFVKETLRYGAKGYLIKKEAKDFIINAIYKIANGEKYLSKSIEALLENERH